MRNVPRAELVDVLRFPQGDVEPRRGRTGVVELDDGGAVFEFSALCEALNFFIFPPGGTPVEPIFEPRIEQRTSSGGLPRGGIGVVGSGGCGWASTFQIFLVSSRSFQ